MGRILVALLAALVLAGPTEEALSQEEDIAVIPAALQQIAAASPLADRLGIQWGDAKPEDVARYFDFRVAANEIATVIAEGNGRERPTGRDYIASLATLCIWPPNKPPFVEAYWPRLSSAFQNRNLRMMLRDSVGPMAIALPSALPPDSPPGRVGGNDG